MKLTPLEKHNGKYDLTEVPEKLNEIIELLNNSFITQDADTAYVNVNKSVLTNISCDRLTPLDNETTRKPTNNKLANIFDNSSIYDGIKCPECGAMYFDVGPSYCTAVYYPTIIKDGVNMNPDRNKYVTTYICCECGHRWEQ